MSSIVLVASPLTMRAVPHAAQFGRNRASGSPSDPNKFSTRSKARTRGDNRAGSEDFGEKFPRRSNSESGMSGKKMRFQCSSLESILCTMAFRGAATHHRLSASSSRLTAMCLGCSRESRGTRHFHITDHYSISPIEERTAAPWGENNEVGVSRHANIPR